MKSFKSQLKLKHLEIKWVWDCPVHYTLQTLLRSYASDMVTFNILTHWPSNFPKLQEIIFEKCGQEKDWPGCKVLVSNLLDRAPNLRRIVTEDMGALKMIPEGKNRLLHQLVFRVTDLESEILLRKVAEAELELRNIFGLPVQIRRLSQVIGVRYLSQF